MSDQQPQIAPQDLAVIALGIDAETFRQSPIGRYLDKRAQEMVFEGLNGLRTVDPENAKDVRAFQNKVVLGESFMQWIGDAIDEGRNTEQQVIARENTD